MRGKIKWFDAQKGYGFITAEDGKEIFVHFSSIESGRTYVGLDKEDTVEFEIGKNNKGPQAINVNLVMPVAEATSTQAEAAPVAEAVEVVEEETQQEEVETVDQTEEVLDTEPDQSDVVPTVSQ